MCRKIPMGELLAGLVPRLVTRTSLTDQASHEHSSAGAILSVVDAAGTTAHILQTGALAAGPTWTAEFGGTEDDGDYTLTFTGFGLPAPVDVVVARATTPATNDDLAAAMDAELVIQNDTDGDIEGILAAVSSATDTVSIEVAQGLPSGVITSSAPVGASITLVNTTARNVRLQYDSAGMATLTFPGGVTAYRVLQMALPAGYGDTLSSDAGAP